MVQDVRRNRAETLHLLFCFHFDVSDSGIYNHKHSVWNITDTKREYRMPKFTPRPRKQKARQRQADLLAKIAPTTGDSNAAEQIPSTKEEKEARKRQLREDLRAQQPASKASSQKRKRLDKYIVCVTLSFIMAIWKEQSVQGPITGLTCVLLRFRTLS